MMWSGWPYPPVRVIGDEYLWPHLPNRGHNLAHCFRERGRLIGAAPERPGMIVFWSAHHAAVAPTSGPAEIAMVNYAKRAHRRG